MTPADRHHRQRLLPQIGPAGQAKLAQSRLLLIGCGALGSALAELLVRAGIGFLRIIDRDLVEWTNLQRQLLFREQDAAQSIPKSIAAAARLAEIDSTIKIDPIVADVHAHNIKKFLADGIDLILDGTDNVATRYLINDLAVQQNIPWIYGAAVGVSGRVLGIWPTKTACLRCLFPKPPSAAHLPTCNVAGVLGPAATIVASLQAATAIRFLVTAAPASAEPLISIDAWQSEFRSLIDTHPQPDCPCCAHHQFPFLESPHHDQTVPLCGRDSVQIQSHHRAHLHDYAARWESLGLTQTTPWYVRCTLTDPPGITLTLFPDGRLIIHGLTDPARARSIHARFVGG